MLVFDASTLILLARAELLDEFLANFEQDVVVPREVERESCGEKMSVDALMIRKAIDDGRIRVMQVKNRKLQAKLMRDFPIGKGEAEAVVLALSARAKVRIVAIDDKHGINACKLLGLPFTTAIGILVRMREKKLLSQDEATEGLGALERYGRYGRGIIDDARATLRGMK